MWLEVCLKETFTLLTILVKTIYYKMENNIGRYHYWYSQKNLQNFQRFQLSAVFNFQEWQYWISSGPSRPKRIPSTRNKFPVNGFLFIYKLKINAKLKEKTLARWDMPPHHVATVNYFNLQSQSFVLNILISCHGRFKVTKKTSLGMSWNYQN